MPAKRPRRPWRVTLLGPDTAVESDHTSLKVTYDYLAASLRSPAHPAVRARVLQWDDGRWQHYETVHAEDLPPAADPT
jgi:hypothetical protein